MPITKGRRHQPITIKQCTMCPDAFMSVGVGPGAVDIRLSIPRPISLDKYGYNATGKCPKHPRPLVPPNSER